MQNKDHQKTLIWLALLAGLAWILFSPLLPYLLSEWKAKSQQHCPYMVLISLGIVVWMWRQGKFEGVPRVRQVRWGALALGGSMGLLVLGTLADVNPVKSGAWIFIIASLVLLFFGWHILRLVWFPIAFLIFAVPKYAIVDMTTFPLQLLSAKNAAVMGSLMGLNILREGVMLTLNPGLQSQYKFEVAAPCSGMNSLESLLIIGSLFIMFVFTLSNWRKAVLFALIVPIAILLNAFRIALTFLLANVFGPKAAEGFFHEFSGIVVYVLDIMCLVGLARALEMIPLKTVWAYGGMGVWVRRLFHAHMPTRPHAHTSPLPYAPAVGLFALAAVAIWLFSTPKPVGGVKPPLERVPLVLGDWRGEEEPKDSPENKLAWEILQPDAMITRQYERQGSSRAEETVNALAIISRSHRSFHVPDFCLRGAGWNPVHERVASLSVPARADASQSRTVPINLSIVQKEFLVQPDQPPVVDRNLILYWYYSGEYATSSMKRLQIYMALSRLLGKHVYGSHIRLTLPLAQNEKEAFQQAQRFIRLLMPEIYRVEVAAPSLLSRAQKMGQRFGMMGWLLVGMLLVAPLVFTIYAVRRLSSPVPAELNDDTPPAPEAEKAQVASGKTSSP